MENKLEKLKMFFWINLVIVFVWFLTLGLIEFINKQNWCINGNIVILALVSYWIKNTWFKK